MNPYLIVDAHEDLAYNAVVMGRDFQLAAHETRQRESEAPQAGVALQELPRHGGTALLGLPDLLRGNVRVVFATLYATPANNPYHLPGRSYQTAAEADALAREQLAYYAILAADPRITLITSRADLERVIAAREPKLGLVLLMEGADPIMRPEDAPSWFAAGVRLVTELGRALMRELSRAGFILDTSHLSEASFFEALDLFEGTIIASHSNARVFVPTDRHLSDEMVKALIARDGVVGVVLYNAFLKQGWREAGAHKEAVSLATAVDHIQHMCDLAGDARHVGIGSDFDGGFGVESAPREIDTVADLQKLGEALSAANFGDEAIVSILSGNWLRILRKALPADGAAQ
jgi:membrane dipeptidase